MLVLTRRAGESVIIGDEVVVTVVEVRGDVVRLGIQAPREVKVHREEVYRAVGEANAAAARSSDDDIARLTQSLRPPGPGGSTGPAAGPGAAPTPAPGPTPGPRPAPARPRPQPPESS